MLLVAAGLVAPLAVEASRLPPGTTPAACVPGGSQVSTSGESFVAVPTSPGEVYVFDSTSGAPLGQPITVGNDPVAMAIDTTLSQLYVLNEGGAGSGPSVSVYNYATGQLSNPPVNLPGGSAPSAIAVSPGGNHVIVAEPGNKQLGDINPSTLQVSNINVPGPASDVAFSGDIDTLYAGDTTNNVIYISELSSSAPFRYSYQSTYSDSNLKDPAAFVTAGQTLYVGDPSDDKVDIYTMGHNGQNQGTLAQDPRIDWSVPNPPDDLAVTPSGGTLFVASGGQSFLEILTASGTQVSEAAPSNDNVGPMAVNADGTVLELGSTTQGTVERFAVLQNDPQEPVPATLADPPSAIASVPSGSLRFYAYVAQSAAVNSDGTGDVSVIDLDANADIADIPVGVNPEAVLPAPSGATVYVADTGTGSNGSLKVINTSEINTGGSTLVEDISSNPAIPFSSGAFLNALAVDPSGDQLLVSDFNRGVVYDIDLGNSGHPMTQIYLDGAGTTSTYNPVTIAMSPNGLNAYVTDHSDHAITVLQTSGQDQPFTYDTTIVPTSPSLSNPHGAAVSPDGRTLYVADEGGGTLDAFPIERTGLLGAGRSVSVGSDPEDVAVSPLGSPIYVAEAGTDQTAIVTAGTLAVTQGSAGPLPTGAAVTPDAGEYLVTNNNTCTGAGSLWIYGAGQTSPLKKINFDINNDVNNTITVTNPFDVAVSPALSAPAKAQLVPAGELSGGGENPSEAATRTAANDVRAGVDTATGSYSLTLPGLSVASPGLPLDFSASYDSANAATAGPLGDGWTFSYAMTLAAPASGNGCQWTVSQENASLASFFDVIGTDPCGDPLGDFGPPARVQAALSEQTPCPLGPTSCYRFTRQGDMSFFFSTTEQNGSYPLIGEQDAYDNTVTLTYGACSSSELSTVSAQGAGLSGTRSLSFNWNCGAKLISSVVDPLGRQIAFTYSGSNLGLYDLSGGGDRLSAHTFEFSYDSNHDVVNWWDPDNSNASGYPSTLPATDAGTAVAYGTYPSQNSDCTASTTAATSVTGPQVQDQGTLGTTTFNPETTIDYSAYDFCTGQGAVRVTDPNQNANLGSQSGNKTVDYYVGRALLSTTSGYGPLDAGVVEDNPADGHPDAASAVTIYVRDPETLATRELVDPDGNLTDTEYNALGDPVQVTKPNGGTTDLLYDPFNQLTVLTQPPDAAGGPPRSTSWVYQDVAGKPPLLQSTTDAAGNETQYLQAPDGQTCEVLNPNAAAAGKSLPGSCGAAGSNPGLTTTTFDSYGDPASVTDPDGDVTSSAYDADGELCGTQSPDGYVANGTLLTACPAASGGPYLTVYPSYDVFGDVLEKTTPAQAGQSNGNSWLTYYDPDGRKVAAMTPNDTSCNGNTTSNCTYATYDGYDNEGDLTSVTDDYDSNNPNGNVTSYTYDADGNRLSTVSPDGNASQNPDNYRTVYSYDDLDRLIATQDPQGSPTCNPQTTAQCPFVSYEAYDPAGRVVTETTPTTLYQFDGTTTITSYDGDGNVTDVQVWDESGPSEISNTTDSYYADDQLETTTEPDGYMSGQTSTNWQTTDNYDADGRTSSVVAPAGLGNTSGQGAGAGTTWTFYDADGNKVAVTNGQGSGGTCNAAVDNPQNPPVCADTTYYAYDLADRLNAVTGAAGQASDTTTSYADDADGNVHVVTNPSGATTTSSYDSADELTGVAYSDGTPSVSYAYNLDGTRASMSASGTGSYDFTYSYDKAARLTSVMNGSATVAAYGYDASSNVTSLTYPSGLVVTNGYAVDDELSSVSWGTGNQLSFTHQQDGTLGTTTAQAGSGKPSIATTDSYDGGQRLDDLSTTSTAQSSPILVTNYEDSNNANVQLDPNGNPLGEEVTTGTVNQPTVYYAVDFVNRANYDSTTAPSSFPVSASAQTYTYNKANFVTQGSTVAVQQYYGDGEIEQATTTGSLPQTVSVSYDPEQDRIGESTPTATTSYAFDAAGEMCWSASTATIPAGGTTPSCSSPPTGATTYTCDGDGLRRSETTGSGTQTFSWDAQSGVPRLLEDGQNDYVYGPGGTPLAQVALGTGAVDFLVPDREGSVRDVVSGSTGLSLAYTDYDVYGNPTASGGLSLLTPFAFQGGYSDATGLVYFQQRYYDPGSGQFLSLDPLNGMTYSGYTFVKDDPLDGADPTGQLYSCGNACGGAAENCDVQSCEKTPNAAAFNPPLPGMYFDAADQGPLMVLGHTPGTAIPGFDEVSAQQDVMDMFARYAGIIPYSSSQGGCGYNLFSSIFCGTLQALFLVGTGGLGDTLDAAVAGVRIADSVDAALGATRAAEGDADVVYRYVSDGEKIAAENSGFVPNTDVAGNSRSVFYSPDEYTSASEAEHALQIGSENPGGATASPTWRLTVSPEGGNWRYAGNVEGGTGIEMLTENQLRVLLAEQLEP